MDLAEVINLCNTYCVGSQNLYCDKTFDLDINGDGVITSDEKSKTCKDLGVSCNIINCGTTYPGYYMETDKKEYSETEVIYLTITSSTTSGGNVDVYVMSPNYNEKYIVHSGISIEHISTVNIPIFKYKDIFTKSGEYLLLLCEGGKECVSGVNTNSIPVYVNIQEITPPITCEISDVYTIEKSGNKLNLGQTLYNIDPSITDTELGLLKDQTLIDDVGTNTGDHDYTQQIDFTNAPTGQLVFAADTSGNRAGRPAGTYLKFSSAGSRWAWNYNLKITGPAVKVKDAADLKNNVLIILGKPYVITNVLIDNGNIRGLTLNPGIQLEEGKNVNSYGIVIDNSFVHIINENGFKGLTISYQPQDDLYLSERESLKDPIFGAFDIYFRSIQSH
ncbi:hypothetical protein J4404_02360 [Candidatus Woesearchaeota archaeon]|nr:hypothetical protein [Candidatus Woesearchaeota archaeon]